MSDYDNISRDVIVKMASADFDQAYQKGFFHALFNRLRGKQSGLFSFDEIRRNLSVTSQVDRGMKVIPIEKIIGSLNRYQDFNDRFLPVQRYTRQRWINIDRVHLVGEYLPPVEVYQLGDFYFVIDGNHRISVAKEKGQKFIDAHVIELEIPFRLEGKFNWHDLWLKQEKAHFYEKTGISTLRLQADIHLSLIGQYEKLLEHIAVHRYYTSKYLNREITYEEAVCSWYDYIYLPMIKIIRQKKVMRHFPGRSETDLYLWIIEHLEFLRQEYHKPVSFDEAVQYFTKEKFHLWFRELREGIFHFFRKFFGK